MRHDPPARDGIPSLLNDGEALPEVAFFSCMHKGHIFVSIWSKSGVNHLIGSKGMAKTSIWVK